MHDASRRRRPPIIKPIVAAQQHLSAGDPQEQIARPRLARGEVIDPPIAARRRAAPAPCACAARARSAASRTQDRRAGAPCWSARTAASSIAIAAPWARNGSIGWAASPRSVTGPSPHGAERRQVVQRPFLPALRHREELAHRLRPVPRRVMRQQFVALAVRAPAGLGPAVVDDRDDVDELCRPSPDSGRHARSARARAARRGREILPRRCPREPARARRCAGGIPAAGCPSRARSPDHSPSAPISAMPCSSAVAAPRRQATLRPVGVHDEILDPRAEPEHDVGIGAHRVEQRGLQVGAMDRPVGRAVAALGLVAERRCARVCRRSRS